jgi:hypothetical protein
MPAKAMRFIRSLLIRHWVVLAAIVGLMMLAALRGRLNSPLDIAVAVPTNLVLGLLVGGIAQPIVRVLIGRSINTRMLSAYLPVVCATFALWLAEAGAAHVARAGSLDLFFAGSATLLGVLLIPVAMEMRGEAICDPWLHAFQRLWFFMIAIGILFALVGLTPDQSQRNQRKEYPLVWFGLVGALSGFAVLSLRDPSQKHRAAADGDRHWRGVTTTSTATWTRAPQATTRTPARATPASRRAAPR